MISIREAHPSIIADEYISAMSDPDLLKYTEARWFSWSRENLEDYFENSLKSNQTALLAVFIQNRHVGNLRLHSRDDRNLSCELGLLIFARDCWGQGIGTKAVLEAVDYARSVWGTSRIMADYFEENLGSQKVFQKAGFTVEGRFENHFRNFDGSFSNSIRVAKNLEMRGRQD